MKRHFSFGFKALAACAMSAMLAVSCYDDSALRTELEGVKGDLTELADRLSKLETSLNDQVAALNTAIGAVDAKVAVVKVEEKDGNYVLTFSNGKTLVVSAADANANNTGLVTTITEDDVTYWAVVGEDGVPVKLDAVVHPDTQLSFKVNPETGLLEVSYDGKTYESTGVFVNDDTTFNVVEAFEETEDAVVLTVGGIKYELPKVSANYFEIVSGMQYFTTDYVYEPPTYQPAIPSKNIPVMMDGIVSYLLAKSPKGWTVELTDDALIVTPPDVNVLDREKYDESGVIEVWVVTEDGQTKVGTVKVSVGAYPVTFTYTNNFKDVNVTLGFNDAVYFGVVKASEYDADAIAEKVLASQTTLADGVFMNPEEDGNFVLSKDYKFADLFGSDPIAGETYRFWSVYPTFVWDYSSMIPARTMVVTSDDLVYEDVLVYTVTAADPVVTFKDATIDVSVEGVDQFYLGFVDFNSPIGGMLDSDNFIASLEGLTQQAISSGMASSFWEVLTEGIVLSGEYPNYIAPGKVINSSYKGSVSDFACIDDLVITPGGTYCGIILPIIPGKKESDYVVSDLYVLDMVTLPELKYDGDATVTFAEQPNVVNWNNFEISVTTTGSRVYYTVAEEGTYDLSNQDLILDLTDPYTLCYFETSDEDTFTIKASKWCDEYGTLSSFEKGTNYVVIAFAVSEDGKCGEVVSKVVKTADTYSYSQNISVNVVGAITYVENKSLNKWAAVATFAITGNATKIYYGLTAAVNVPNQETDPDEYNAYLDTIIYESYSGEGWTMYSTELTSSNMTDGKITIGGTFDSNGNTPFYIGNDAEKCIIAFVEDAEGNMSTLTIHKFTPPAGEY